MRPKQFPQVNVTLTAPTDLEAECESLPVLRWKGGVLSCWELTDEEIAAVVRHRQVWLNVFGHTTPPVWISAEVDFEQFPPIETPPAPPVFDVVTTEELRIFREAWRDAHEALLESDPEEAEVLLNSATEAKFSGRRLVPGGRIQ